MTTNKITLPFPPSANRYWRNWRGRMVVSDEARMYKAKAGYLAKRQGTKRLSGPVAILANFYRPAKRGDLDNLLKVTLDALKGIAYEDDSQIERIEAHRFDDKANPRVEIYIGSDE